jgi:solute carrier family 50 (sugar transporter)
MWGSPFSAILQVRKSGSLGSLNPIPFGITGHLLLPLLSFLSVTNCIGWVIYGILRHDYFLFFSNISGLVLGLFYSLSSISALSISGSEKDLSLRLILEMMLIGSALGWGTVGLIVGVSLPPELTEAGIVSIGFLGCGCALGYYVSFLTTIAHIIRTKDSSSLYLPTLLTNMTNATLWVIYGTAVQDPVIWLPNLLGATLTIFQIGLYFVYYPRQKSLQKGDNEYILQNIQQSDVQNPLSQEETVAESQC